jgi:maltose/moltooligosaccharide transporter
MTAATMPAAAGAATGSRPKLSIAQILQMNLGFLGLQFSFGLQQANMSPIWGYLGAEEKNFAWLGIAGPLTGLIVQPIIGTLSDRTSSRWGRRTPYFLVGALMCALGLFLMPLAASVLMAFSLLFLLDVGNNVTMEPYRAYVNDRLEADQRGFGFLSQSAFTGLAQCLAYLSPTLLVTLFGLSRDATQGGGIPTFTLVSFWIGSVLSLGTILWSITRVPEIKLPDAERARLAALPKNPAATLAEIFSAIRNMPKAMRGMAWMSLFQWYAMSGYWGYVTNSISRSVYSTADASTAAYREAVLTNGQVGAFFNLIAFLAALSMAPLAKRLGAGRLHAFCLTLSGIAMLAIPLIGAKELLFVAAIGIGLGWGSIMGNPYIILADTIPPERTGVYMGIFNMFICVPMLIFAGTMSFAYEPLLGGDARNVLRVSGICMLLAAFAVWRIKEGRGSAVAAG